MVGACGDLDDLQSRRQRGTHRDCAIRGGAVAELAVAVPAPGPDAAVRLDRERVVAAAGDGDDVLQAVHAHRDVALRVRVVPEISELVVAPGPHGAVRPERERMVAGAGDL